MKRDSSDDMIVLFLTKFVIHSASLFLNFLPNDEKQNSLYHVKIRCFLLHGTKSLVRYRHLFVIQNS